MPKILYIVWHVLSVIKEVFHQFDTIWRVICSNLLIIESATQTVKTINFCGSGGSFLLLKCLKNNPADVIRVVLAWVQSPIYNWNLALQTGLVEF